MQFRMGVSGSKTEILRSTLGIKTASYSDGFEQSGFAGAVLTHKKGNGRMESQPVKRSNGCQLKGVSVKRLHRLSFKHNLRKILR